MSTEDEFLDKKILEEAREALDWEADNNVEQLAGVLIILLRGVLDRLLQEIEKERQNCHDKG